MQYQGWWHEFESYATEENRGDCVSARYSVSGTTVQYVGTGVFGLNSQVITGTVVVGPNGKLTKTLSNGNVEGKLCAKPVQRTVSIHRMLLYILHQLHQQPGTEIHYVDNGSMVPGPKRN